MKILPVSAAECQDKFLNPAEFGQGFQDAQIELGAFCQGLSNIELKTLMAWCNHTLHQVATNYHAASKYFDDTGKPRWRFSIKSIKRLMRLCQDGNVHVDLALVHTLAYAKSQWKGAAKAIKTLRRIRDMLKETSVGKGLRFFDCEKRYKGDRLIWSEENEPKSAPTRYDRINVPLLLMLFQQLEFEWLARGNNFDDLPGHKGNFVRQLFNAVLGVIRLYRRDVEFTAPDFEIKNSLPYDSPELAIALSLVTGISAFLGGRKRVPEKLQVSVGRNV